MKRARPPPSGRTSNGAAIVTSMMILVRTVVAASRTSGDRAYQGWKDGASAIRAATASAAP